MRMTSIPDLDTLNSALLAEPCSAQSSGSLCPWACDISTWINGSWASSFIDYLGTTCLPSCVSPHWQFVIYPDLVSELPFSVYVQISQFLLHCEPIQGWSKESCCVPFLLSFPFLFHRHVPQDSLFWFVARWLSNYRRYLSEYNWGQNWIRCVFLRV